MTSAPAAAIPESVDGLVRRPVVIDIEFPEALFAGSIADAMAVVDTFRIAAPPRS